MLDAHSSVWRCRGRSRSSCTWTMRATFWLTVSAFSRPATAAARLAGPLASMVQRSCARRCGAVLPRLSGVQMGRGTTPTPVVAPRPRFRAPRAIRLSLSASPCTNRRNEF
ncbi:DUF1990 family protein [Actinomadura mexicana]|uniref:DUF1990 family protein n=1 Tax=Actinomadura mexicana TaxID=134959 RepID=UPI003CCB7454